VFWVVLEEVAAVEVPFQMAEVAGQPEEVAVVAGELEDPRGES